MTATLDDLRAALRDSAEQAQSPDPATTLHEVAWGVRAADRRRRGGVAAVTAAVLAVGSGLFAWDHAREAATTEVTSVVTDDSAFPAYDRGLKRLTIVDLPLSGRTRAVISTRERSQNLLYITAYCTRATTAEAVLSATSADRQKYVPCPTRPQNGSSDSSRPVLWRPADATGELVVEPTLSAQGSGHARVAVYQEVAWGDYRFPPRPHDLESDPGTAWPATTSSEVFTGPTDPAQPNEPVTVTVTPQRYLSIRLHARAPGELRVTVDGKPTALRCIGDLGPRACDAGSSDTFTQWSYGRAEAGRWLDLDEESTGLRPGQPVTITVRPTWFAGDDWRLEVSTPKR